MLPSAVSPYIPYGSEAFNDKQKIDTEYLYDQNGSTTADVNTGISTIQYNLLNLPDVVQFKNGNQIKNTYNAGGQKLGTEYFTWVPGTNAPVVNTGDVLNISYSQGAIDQNGTVYIGNFEYNTKNGNSSLTAISRIHNTEGYVENPGSPQYYYYRKDHLGNNREVWLANTNSTVQRTQYYPSGLPWVTTWDDNQSTQPYKYNGKEFVEMHGYDTYDYGWRGYYPALGSFTSVDPLAEKKTWMSPYVYCSGNPVNRTDPDGRADIYGVNPKRQTDFGVMLVLPSSFRKDEALQADFDNAKKNKIPIMVVDNIKDFQEGLTTLKDEKVNVNAFSISQHGAPGNAKIGDDPVSAKSDFTPLKEGLSGKNVMFSQCSVTENSNSEGIATLKQFSNTTNANATVTADQTVPAGNVLGSQKIVREGIIFI
jgi:RHS repeat-associated protein